MGCMLQIRWARMIHFAAMPDHRQIVAFARATHV